MRLYFILYLSIFLNLALYGQNSKFEHGPKASINTTWIYNKKNPDTLSNIVKQDFLIAPDIGYHIKYNIKPWIGINLAIQYSLKGTSNAYYKRNKLDQNFILLHYAEFPILIDFNIKSKYIIGAGLAPSFKLSDNVNSYNIHYSDVAAITQIGINHNRFEYGLNAKFGIIPLLRIIGTNILSRDSENPDMNILELYNQSIGLYISYNLGKKNSETTKTENK